MRRERRKRKTLSPVKMLRIRQRSSIIYTVSAKKCSYSGKNNIGRKKYLAELAARVYFPYVAGKIANKLPILIEAIYVSPNERI